MDSMVNCPPPPPPPKLCVAAPPPADAVPEVRPVCTKLSSSSSASNNPRCPAMAQPGRGKQEVLRVFQQSKTLAPGSKPAPATSAERSGSYGLPGAAAPGGCGGAAGPSQPGMDGGCNPPWQTRGVSAACPVDTDSRALFGFEPNGRRKYKASLQRESRVVLRTTDKA